MTDSKKQSSKKKFSPLVAAAVATAAFAVVGVIAKPAQAAPTLTSFTPGDLVVLQGGDATNSDTSGGNAYNGQVNAYLDEYTTTGTLVGTLPVGSNLTLAGYGVDSHEGVLSLSSNGNYLSFAGYSTPAGATAHATDGSETGVLAVVGNSAASLNTTTTLTPAEGTGQYVRGAITVNGNQFYEFGKYPSGTTAGNGIQYVQGVGPSATVTTIEGSTDWRDLTIENNTLYGGTGSSSVGTHGAYLIGSAGTVPTTAAPGNTLLTNYSGGQSASGVVLLDVPTNDPNAGTQNGYDVMYTIGDQSTSGITKYYFNTSTGYWTPANLQVSLNANNIVNPTGIVAQIDPTNPADVDLYVSGQNGIYSYVDASGDPTTGLAANSFSVLATPGANQAFYGIAAAPTAVPEPASAGLLAAGAVAALARRRRRA